MVGGRRRCQGSPARSCDSREPAGLHRAMVDALLVPVRTSFNEEQESDPEKIELLEQALTFLDDEPALRARVLGMLAIELIFVGDSTRRGSLLDEARQLARRSGDPPRGRSTCRCATSTRRPRSGWSTLQNARGPSRRDRGAGRAEQLGDAERLAAMHLQSFFVAFICGDGAQARAHAAALSELNAAGNPLALRMLLMAEQMISDGRRPAHRGRGALDRAVRRVAQGADCGGDHLPLDGAAGGAA